MNLLEYMNKHKNIIEFTVFDEDYDIEVYFFNEDDEDLDDWKKAMKVLASKLQVIEQNGDYVTVDLSNTIEGSMESLKQNDLFYNYDIDVIMDSIMDDLAGNVSEKWMVKFANALK